MEECKHLILNLNNVNKLYKSKLVKNSKIKNFNQMKVLIEENLVHFINNPAFPGMNNNFIINVIFNFIVKHY